MRRVKSPHFAFVFALTLWIGLGTARPVQAAPPPPTEPYRQYLTSVYAGYTPTYLPLPLPAARVVDLLTRITPAGLAATVGDLSGEQPAWLGEDAWFTFTTRYSGAPESLTKALRYAEVRLTAAGLTTTRFDYTLPSMGPRQNLSAERPGRSHPEQVFLLTAHLDSFNWHGPTISAPGADDNASGTAGVLAVADALRATPTDCTLRYVLFTGEEQGLYGSHFYAADLASRGEALMGVLNLDMIGYDAVGDPVLDLHTRPGDPPEAALAATFISVTQAYGLPLAPLVLADGVTYSDHSSFWEAGYPALLAIENDDDFNPYYHTADDRLDKLNLDYMTAVSRAALAAIAHAGCLLEPAP